MVNMLVEETKRYALFCNSPDPNISANELRCFVAIMFLSGYNPVPSKRDYWSSQKDLRNEAVLDAMRRDRFLQICRFIHCADNNKVDSTDKYWKIRPLMNMFKDSCLRHFIPEKNLCYDESMIKYFGPHHCKQFIRGKPIRFGYKAWCINTTDGYLVNYEFYQGKIPHGSEFIEKAFGKPSAPFVMMLEDFPEKMLPYNFYTDNLFSSRNLFMYLKDCGYSAVGTLRENRVPKTCPLTEKKLFMKKPRGIYETAVNKKEGLLYCRWMDNSAVTTLSTDVGASGGKMVTRYSKESKAHIQVYQPQLIGDYNRSMGGTDRMDQNINCYRSDIHGNKWWWPIFTWLMDVARHNSYCLYKKNNRINQLQYTRQLVLAYLSRYGSTSKGAGRWARPSASRVSDMVRYEGTRHLIEFNEGKKRRRCAGQNCKTSCNTVCGTCDVGLCIACFKSFHTKN
ncbi:hypothetical protein M8J77_020281 [Diaphorina citri]|nr:hypothetical protein M8J77_020281 [Diaphorina citri]